MASYNTSTTTAADILSSSVAVAAANGHFERTSAATAATTTTFIVPSSATSGAPLQLEPFITSAPHFVTTSNTHSPVSGTAHQQQPLAAHQQQHHHHHQQTNSTSTSYTFVQIKREPCQVSEVTSANCHQPQQQQQHHHHHQQQQSCTSSSNGSMGVGIASSSSSSASIAATGTSKTMSSSSSTLTTLVKIEASSPKVQELDKGQTLATLNTGVPTVGNTTNSVPIGIAVARKRTQEASAPLSNSTAIPVQQSLNKDLNCFGIRVADLGGVSTGCGNIYFTGNGDLMTSSATTAEELALNAAGMQSMNRAPSTFWQYPNALPIESVISMSPATVGLQYSRDASRGQVVLLPATPAALGISNFPLYTPTDPFQQAAAFVWPSYIPQGTTPAAAAAAATLQPPPNFIFPSMSPHSTLQPQSYATSLQLFGSNYLTAAAAAAAAAAATSTLCQHNQSNSTTSSINLSLGATGTPTAGSSSTTSSSTSSRFLSLSTTPAGIPTADNQKSTQKTLQSALSLPPPPPAAPLIIPPAAMKIEDWATVDFMSRANGTTTTLGHQPAHHLSSSAPAVSLNFESRDKTTTTTTTTTNLLELQNAANAQQALNLMRLPTPPTSATIETAAVAAAGPQLQPQLLFQATTSPSPALLNLSAANLPRAAGGGSANVTPAALTPANFLNGGTTTLTATIGPPTPLGDETALNFKTSSLDTQQPQIVVGVPRVITSTQSTAGPPPQMQDVNIQTDTPVCSEDENSSCPLAIQQQHQQQQQTTTQSGATEHVYAHDTDAQQPLELTKPHVDVYEEQPQNENGSAVRATNECHNEGGITVTTNGSAVGASSTSTPQDEQCNGNEPMLQNTANSCCEQSQPSAAASEIPVVNESLNSSAARVEATPEDLTGLELLSNISTSTLASKNMPIVRVKQEPMDHTDAADTEEMLPPTQQQSQSLILNCAPNGEMQNLTLAQSQQPQPHAQLPPRPPSEVEPLGGLNLLCALAEQRIQEEEVQCGGNGVFAPDASENSEMVRHQQSTARVTPSFVFQQQQPLSFRLEQSFPSMEGIELPSTSGMCGGEPVKRKKHKHSKSSKSSSSASASTSGKKSQRCSKKAKKYSKEKRKHKLLSSDELDFDDEQLQEELKSALDPSYQLRLGKWTNAQEIFKLMESNMRMRLADITRQYRKKKRKLDEITKNKKKKKCSKLLAAQQQQAALSVSGTSGLSLVGATTSGLTCGSASLPLCDYKFPKFSKSNSSVSGTVGAGATSTPYLNRSTFLRFGETATTPMSHAQFPPPDVDLCDDDDANQAHATPSASSMGIYKPVRLGPSALAGAVAATDNRGSSILRLAQKHVATDKGESVLACKEHKFMTVSSSSGAKRTSETNINGSSIYNGDDCSANTVSPMSLKLQTQSQLSQVQQQQQQQQQSRKPIDPMDGQLMLTSDHLYRKETRVLTDMGGLFYAGIMKPLQPPDIYAITLDGERGNKPHIMSREEILKDTILEVAPKSVESVPVGTRLCAYWSQQYRCLYPGRAIESESSDDGETPRDFVSVEFDDGDSGRIRLQNIRFLLSDYPIVEYNDNPLYSLGKHKKSGGKSGSLAAHDGHQSHEQPTSLADLPTSTGNELQTNAAREAYAQRSEKKRIKSLKKKTQAALVASTTSLNGIGANESAEYSRKHHKHKKRKKHKKHHHRKANGENEDGPNTFVIRTVAASSSSSGYVAKSEQQVEANSDDQDDEEMAEVENEMMSQVAEMEETTAHRSAQSAIKVETTATTNGGVKVKTEHLELEEESASNMMSEVSDENKCDDGVEHNNSKGSKIAAFLPERQLWGWLGKAYRKAGVKGRARKQFYKTIKRGKETITVGDCAVFLSTGRPDRPYIGRIESMWETTSSNKVVRVRWFYHPEETTGCPKLKYPGALFESPHEDENDVQTISHRCEVLSFARYFGKFGADSKQYQSIYDNNDTYYLAGYYNPRLQVLNLQKDIPALEAEHTGVEADDNATANV